MTSLPPQGGSEARSALVAGVISYLFWGFAPLLFQVIGARGAAPLEIMAHRVLWGLVAAIGFVWAARQWGQVLRILRQPRMFWTLALCGLLIGSNWLFYIWAVNSGRMLETSLGYYITPLLNMAAGALIFHERINLLGKAAIGLAVLGVVIQTLALGHVPALALWLATSFGIYGILRKKLPVEAQAGLFIETLVLLPIAAGFLAWVAQHGGGHFDQDPLTMALLIACGPVTALPLALFAWAAKRMPLSSMGFLQFMGPTIGFFIGAFQGEPLSPLRLTSFAFIWAGAAVFIFGALRAARRVSSPETRGSGVA